jgi:flagellar biosynthesis protein FlhB
MIEDRLGKVFLGAWAVATVVVVVSAMIPGQTNPIERVLHVIGSVALLILVSLVVVFFILVVLDVLLRRPK